MTRSCVVCGTPTKKTCIGCSRQAYCSRQCQSRDWICHILDCDAPGREITSADRLAAALVQGHPDSSESVAFNVDYGFMRVSKVTDVAILRRVYEDIFLHIGVKPNTVHKWQVRGRLHEELVVAYRKAGKDSGPNFLWLCQNPQVFDSEQKCVMTGGVRDFGDTVKLYLWSILGRPATDTVEDINKELLEWTDDKLLCYHAYLNMVTYSRGRSMGRSSWSAMNYPDVWLNLGFCVFPDEYAIPAQALYDALMARCTFEEFHEAYSSSSLLALMDRKGLTAARRKMPDDFEVVLSQSPDWIPPVWHLKAWVLCQEEFELPMPGVLLPYGFANCRDRSESKHLMSFYSKLFKEQLISPSRLHTAAENDGIFDYIIKTTKLKIAKTERHFLERVLSTHNRDIFPRNADNKTQLLCLTTLIIGIVYYHLSPAE
ncbi:hypothetical protein SISSUDRAFT_1121023 [Sistotremastrum suecicum HHB10207 ss-3]|uniref:MYND-type domain-containing protein n=1 Tax=Sistotremastrum suecicum HHB10207 ss-3 TaxID=1314776 RepID=A0A166BGE0_9AGAM|nr:hypothetical protein SISSUDRAFT_1121023 [Sistotremastrum suecicum HHB10207 ss-3]